MQFQPPCLCPPWPPGLPWYRTPPSKPYAIIQPISEEDLEELEWKELAKKKLARAWEGEEDALYDYL